jgi:hypothetical protein
MPKLQSELQVTMDAPAGNGQQTTRLKGYVVRVDPGEDQQHTQVGIVFTE